MARLHVLQGEKLRAEVFNAGVVGGHADCDGPRRHARMLPALLDGRFVIGGASGKREKEQPEGAFRWFEVRGDPLDFIQPAERHVHPAHGAGVVIVAFGDDREKVGQARQQCEVHARKRAASLRYRRLDVEIAALENRPGVDVLLEEDDLPGGQLLQGVLHLFLGVVVEHRNQHARFGREARAVAKEVDHGDAFDQRERGGVARFGFGALDRFNGLRPTVAIGGGEDRGFEVRPQVIPIVVRPIPRRGGQRCRFQIGAEAEWFDRGQEPEGASFVLPELPLGDGAEQSRHGRVQRPA